MGRKERRKFMKETGCSNDDAIEVLGKGKDEKENALETYAKRVRAIYEKKLNDEIPRAVILGGFTVYDILHEKFILPILESKTAEERNENIEKLIEKVESEYQNIKNQREKAKVVINGGKADE